MIKVGLSVDPTHELPENAIDEDLSDLLADIHNQQFGIKPELKQFYESKIHEFMGSNYEIRQVQEYIVYTSKDTNGRVLLKRLNSGNVEATFLLTARNLEAAKLAAGKIITYGGSLRPLLPNYYNLALRQNFYLPYSYSGPPMKV